MKRLKWISLLFFIIAIILFGIIIANSAEVIKVANTGKSLQDTSVVYNFRFTLDKTTSVWDDVTKSSKTVNIQVNKNYEIPIDQIIRSTYTALVMLRSWVMEDKRQIEQEYSLPEKLDIIDKAIR